MATEANSGARNLIPPKLGEVRNPNGRPKGVPNTKTRLRRLLELTQDLKNPITGEVESFTVLEQLDLQQIIKARRGELPSYKEIIDRLEGKVVNNDTSPSITFNFGEKSNAKRYIDAED